MTNAPARRRWLVAAALAACAACPLPAAAQRALSEPQAMAGFVLNFARYVEWPASAFTSPQAPVLACVVGRDDVAAALAALEGRPVQGRTLRVRRANGLEDLRDCHVAFLGDQDERRLVPLLRSLAGRPVLTISDSDRFIDIGGGIALVRGDERLQFDVNRSALDAAQLKASANLLRLARTVP